jgi:8-oxo-dGTP pyrophosphatase MutT (NUDIX family)
MSIRNSAKAILLRDGKVLLSKCRRKTGGIYYDLPGGGQNPFETMEEAVVRECLEETGYLVRPVRLVAIAEEIFTDEHIRRLYPDYAHKIFHIFLAEIADSVQREITESDYDHLESGWYPVSEVSSFPLLPSAVAERFEEVIRAEAPMVFQARYL